MNEKILVTYASPYGSTQEVAEVIGEVLRSNGLEVDILPLRKVGKLDDYRVVVLGIPLYMFRWHQDARRFLSRQRKAIANGLPVALFTGGPSGTADEDEWNEVRHQVDQELARYPWFKPLSTHLVGGRFDPQKLHFPYSLIPALHQLPATDFRDWPAIRSWASSLVAQFQPALS
jgi:menaquinone-dependent protoporphyrinogen oxidase